MSYYVFTVDRPLKPVIDFLIPSRRKYVTAFLYESKYKEPIEAYSAKSGSIRLASLQEIEGEEVQKSFWDARPREGVSYISHPTTEGTFPVKEEFAAPTEPYLVMPFIVFYLDLGEGKQYDSLALLLQPEGKATYAYLNVKDLVDDRRSIKGVGFIAKPIDWYGSSFMTSDGVDFSGKSGVFPGEYVNRVKHACESVTYALSGDPFMSAKEVKEMLQLIFG